MTNEKMQKKMVGDKDHVMLYRGLGLPEKAIQVYHEYLKSRKRFYFTGFTSTSCEKEQALPFAYQATQRKGLVPVLFVMDTDHAGGWHKAYLHDGSLSAFPKEKEYLIGDVRWKVNDIKKERIEFRGQPIEVTVIYMDGQL